MKEVITGFKTKYGDLIIFKIGDQGIEIEIDHNEYFVLSKLEADFFMEKLKEYKEKL